MTFELERVEVAGGCLVVSGRWSGVRGMRFVRPTLLVGNRQVLATLEHKPWAPDGQPWTAAFPWDDVPLDLEDVVLVVAPSVTVPLDPTADRSQTTTGAGRTDGSDIPAVPAIALPEDTGPSRVRQLERELALQRDELRALADERDALRRELEEGQAIASEHAARSRRAGQDASLKRSTAHELERERGALQRTAPAAERDDRVAARRDEADHDSEGTLRRLQAQLERALQARRDAELQRDQSRAERDEARDQRDKVLLARHDVHGQIDASHDAANARGAHSRDLSRFDLLTIRFAGAMAAACVVLLLAILLRMSV